MITMETMTMKAVRTAWAVNGKCWGLSSSSSTPIPYEWLDSAPWPLVMFM